MELSSFYNYSGPESYNLGIFYSGDSTYPSEDPGDLLSVTSELSPTVLTVTPSSNSPALGSNVTVTVTLGIVPSGPPAGSVPPSGTVTLTVNGVALNPVALSTTGSVTSAVFTVPITAASNSIVASYPGDSNYSGTTASPYILTATKAATNVVLSANSTTAQQGTAVTLTATVTPVVAPTGSAEQNPTGTVVFSNGATVIGSGTLTPVAGTDSAIATLTIQTFSGGSDSITAVYQGDATYGSSTSNLLTINFQGFTLAASSSNPPTNLNLTKGGAGSESFVITGVGGYTGLVQVICTVPTQDDMTCAVSPQQVTPTATVTFVVETYITGGPLYAAAGKPSRPGPLWPQAAGGAMLAGVLFFLLPFGRRARVFLRPLVRQVPRRFIILLILLAGLASTGIGCSSPSTTVTDIGTPLGVATLEVTATAYVDNAVVAQTINFTVNVQPQ
jgi:hypothetical protein